MKNLSLLFCKVWSLLTGRKKIHVKVIASKMACQLVARINTSPLNLFISYKPDSLVNFNYRYFYDSSVSSLNHNRGGVDFYKLKNQFICNNLVNNNGDLNRLLSLILNLQALQAKGVKGAFAELGVYKGNTAAVLYYFALKAQAPLFLFDTYSGFCKKDLVNLDSDKQVAFADTSIALVKSVLAPIIGVDNVDNGVDNKENHNGLFFIKGWFPDTVQELHREATYAAVSLDCDLYLPMKAGLEFFYPRMAPGGIIFVHDYSSGLWPGATQALDEFCSSENISFVLLPDKSGTAVLIRPM